MEKLRHIIPISGKDSLCTAIIQRQAEPDLDYEYLFNPTGAELPEVFDWLKKIEKQMGIKINYVGESLEKLIEKNNYFLPSRRARYCTRQSKIEPMLEFVGEDEANIYFGIRADEDRQGFNNLWSPNIYCEYPLKTANIDIDGVYKIISEAGLKPPTFFWETIYEIVKKRLGFDPREALPEWKFDMLFAWRSRANCYFCFNQRQYEIVGLWEQHPKLAEKALWYESQGPSEKNYTWREKPFDWYKEHKNKIIERRVKELLKIIRKYTELNLFDKEAFDLFSSTSCGLLCGK